MQTTQYYLDVKVDKARKVSMAIFIRGAKLMIVFCPFYGYNIDICYTLPNTTSLGF